MIESELNDLTEKIIGCAFAVSNTLGSGFLEKVYENAMLVELGSCGLQVEAQKPLKVLYNGVTVGDYITDIIVNGRVILELKAIKSIENVHVAQVLNYLKATGFNCGLILNFGKPKLEIKRVRLSV